MPGRRDGAAAKANVLRCPDAPLPYIYMCGRPGSLALLLIGVGAKGGEDMDSKSNPIPTRTPLFPFPSRMGFEDLVRPAQSD